MDEELLELQREFENAQQAKSSIRLSERNVVELVQKLHHLRIIDFDLLHTLNGKQYITPEQLSLEIVDEIKRVGRVSLIDLADTTGVDLYHVETQAQRVISSDPSLMLINGDIISSSYWDNVAEEINERLQECSQIALAELAAQLQVGSELIATVLEPRLGTMVKGRLEGGQLYTPAYVARVSSMVCGAARGITVPMNLSVLWSNLQMLLQETDGASGVAVENSFFQTLFNGLVKEGKILGSLRAGIIWTPAVFAIAQKESVESFFSQNSFIGYEFLHKLGIPQPVQFLQTRYPEGIPLDTIFVHPSIIGILDAAVEDILERNSWIDSLTVLPTSFGSQDAFKILSHCQSVQLALKSSKAILLGESFIFSVGFVKDLFTRMDKEMETSTFSGFSSGRGDDLNTSKAKTGSEQNNSPAESVDSRNESGVTKQVIDKGSKKKKGKSAGNSKIGVPESSAEQEPISTKSNKKSQRRGKDASSAQMLDTKPGAKKDLDKKEDTLTLTEEWLIQKIMSLVPEFEDLGLDDPDAVLRPLANHLRPLLINSWKERRKLAFTENAQKMKSIVDNLQRKVDESFLNLQLYEKALDLFEDDPSASVVLHRHLVRSAGTSIVDTILVNLDVHNKLKNGIDVEESNNLASTSLSAAERIAIAKSLPGHLSKKAIAAVEALEGKQVEAFILALTAVAEESGLTLKKLDKKLERTLLHSYRKDLTAQVSAETDPISILPKVVSLLYVQAYNKALQAPGRAISVAVSRLKEKLDDSAYKTLMDYHGATVSLLALISAATGDDEDCSSDRILTKRELLENLMPALKGLVLTPSSLS